MAVRTALVAEDLTCIRGERLLFYGLSFDVSAGGALRVTGPNGAGKSSLLRLLAGLLEPVAGRIQRPQRTAFLGHENALKADAVLATELGYWAEMDGAGKDALARAIAHFNLEPLLDLPVRMLSNGQRRRAGLARIAAGGADLWLLDEPEVGLDTRSLAALAAAFAEHRERGGIVVVATHMLNLPHMDELALDNPVDAAI